MISVMIMTMSDDGEHELIWDRFALGRSVGGGDVAMGQRAIMKAGFVHNDNSVHIVG